ncbi:diguanylate cyclase [Cupriavidus sp. 2MCAB6]|uniref:sensor domain-containing diguanylate cyclase n=1 Tax=Cupriavidus sp. 2MCAB6 TaxID=3232981 RepID=UPI003F93C41E
MQPDNLGPRQKVNFKSLNLFVASSFVLAVAIAAVGAGALHEMRQDAYARAQEGAANLSLILEHDIARNLEIYELSMHSVIDGVKDPEILRLPPAIRQLVLFDRSTTATDMGSLLVTDEQGHLVLDSRSIPPRPVNLSDRDYFKVHRDSATAGLYVSQPFQPRLTDGGQSIGLSRRLSHADGSFAGIVVGTLRTHYFRRLFEGTKLGPGGTITLLRDDGIVLMRRPYEPSTIGRSIASSPSFAPLTQASQGSYVGTAALDGTERLYNFHHVTGFPLVVVVGLSTDYVYAEWRKRAWLFGGLILALDAMLIALSVLISRQFRRRLAMEKHLRLMVNTDGLTGIGSRRALDEAADIEWRRAWRNQQPLSLLMIDVDHFKNFNDHYGHAGGDDALAAVARCIADSIRRPGDYAARYGGEEFAVLLPNTGMQGTIAVAEKIRSAVESLAIPNLGSANQVLTVSIGVAIAEDRARFASLRVFFNASDEALYEAKASGRNRVAIAADEARRSVAKIAAQDG